MTRRQFQDSCDLHACYKGRWGYYAEAIDTLIRREVATKPYRFSSFSAGVTMSRHSS
jgi:hypothetical protein